MADIDVKEIIEMERFARRLAESTPDVDVESFVLGAACGAGFIAGRRDDRK